MWCMLCKDAESTELVRLLSKDSIITAIKLLQCTPLLHLPISISEVGVSLSIMLCNNPLQISCLTEPLPLQMGQWLGITRPFTEELDCYLPPMSFQAVLSGFTCDLCTWAESKDAGLSVEQRKPEKIVATVRQMLSSSYLAFTVRMDTASTEQAKQLISLRLQTAHSEWWGEHTAGFIDMHRTTLCLIGRAGTKTAPHADWADARNFAVAIGQKV